MGAEVRPKMSDLFFNEHDVSRRSGHSLRSVHYGFADHGGRCGGAGGRSMRETARSHGVAYSWVYELVRRYRAEGERERA